MSAAEKLKVLNSTPLAELGGRLPDGHPFMDLWRALPQIVAVVEAAEKNAIEPTYAEYPQQGELFAALAALDEKLVPPSDDLR